jgi:MoxR-like ATPase
VPGDVQTLAEPVLAHRILMSPSFEASGRTVGDAVAEAIASVPAPPTDQHR